MVMATSSVSSWPILSVEPARPGTYKQNAYKLSSLPDRVTVTRVGHPLCGESLRVIRERGSNRKDRCIGVMLPDGSPILIPIAWTNLCGDLSAGTTESFSARLDVSGLRRLIRLVEIMSSPDLRGKSP